jgi:hypothetical protein
MARSPSPSRRNRRAVQVASRSRSPEAERFDRRGASYKEDGRGRAGREERGMRDPRDVRARSPERAYLGEDRRTDSRARGMNGRGTWSPSPRRNGHRQEYDGGNRRDNRGYGRQEYGRPSWGAGARCNARFHYAKAQLLAVLLCQSLHLFLAHI